MQQGPGQSAQCDGMLEDSMTSVKTQYTCNTSLVNVLVKSSSGTTDPCVFTTIKKQVRDEFLDVIVGQQLNPCPFPEVLLHCRCQLGVINEKAEMLKEETGRYHQLG